MNFANKEKLHELEKVQSNFFPIPCRKAELMEEELEGIENLKKHSFNIYSQDNPSQIFFQEKVYSIEGDNNSINLKFKIPFLNSTKLDVKKTYDELIVTMQHDRGILVNTIALPFVATAMDIISSRIDNNQLEITLRIH